MEVSAGYIGYLAGKTVFVWQDSETGHFVPVDAISLKSIRVTKSQSQYIRGQESISGADLYDWAEIFR